MSDVTIPSPEGLDVTGLRAGLRGALIEPGDETYEEARRVYNAMIDRRPRLIARCADAADVIDAVNFAREHGLTLAVRGGGHNVAGMSVCDDGLVIDLSPMTDVRVDPARRTARVGGGAAWRDVDHATHAFGLAVPSGIFSTTGVGGLTLGGGFGHLSRAHGLSCDNLVSADVVLADGSFVTASEEENEGLFWALRGGGGNFGVVTSFEFRLHPVSTVLGGAIFYPIETTRDAMRFYREYMRSIPHEMSAFFSFHIGPPAPFIPEHLQGVTMAAVIACYAGPPEEGEEVARPLREFGPPALDLLAPIPYPALNSLFDPLIPPGLHHYWKADFVEELTDEMIEVHAEHGPRVPNFLSTMHLYPLSGAIQEIGKDESAFSYRDVEFVHNVVAVDPDPANMPAHTAWVREYWEALHPHAAGGGYVNFLMEEGEERVRATYRGNYDRLAEVKRRYDPQNLFRANQNIKPGG